MALLVRKGQLQRLAIHHININNRRLTKIQINGVIPTTMAHLKALKSLCAIRLLWPFLCLFFSPCRKQFLTLILLFLYQKS
jgi:hypothetical protein